MPILGAPERGLLPTPYCFGSARFGFPFGDDETETAEDEDEECWSNRLRE